MPWSRFWALNVLSLCLLADVTGADLKSLDQLDPERDARVAWHTEARFGCFMHWGIYSALGGEFEGRKGGTYSEHIMRQLKIPRQVYLERVAKPFDPEKFDADAWVKLVHDAGMRYLIITAKHHDGFAMYPSKVSDFNISTTAFKKDPMRELKEACAKYGVKFGFYYSHAFDWEHPEAPGNDWDYKNPGGDLHLFDGPDKQPWYDAHPELLPRIQHYVNEKSIPQIKELIAMYHPDILWFDTPGKLPPSENRRILEAVREADPHVVVNGRLLNNFGDYKNTADRPAEVPYVIGNWEGIPTTNDSYGWSKVDQGHKPPEHFIQLLAKIASKGGNMLMNVGPMGMGEIDPKDQFILNGIGEWMAKNSESIYATVRTPLPVQVWGTSTLKGQRLYLHVFQWPKNGKLLVAGLRTDVKGAYLLIDPKSDALKVKRINAYDVEITVPSQAPDSADSVVVLDCAGPVKSEFAELLLPRDANTVLHVFNGNLLGRGIKYNDGKRNRDTVMDWTNPAGSVEWPVRLMETTRFRISINYATVAKSQPGAFRVVCGNQILNGHVKPTENETTFETASLGEVILKPGEFTISVHPIGLPEGELMRLRRVELTPIR